MVSALKYVGFPDYQSNNLLITKTQKSIKKLAYHSLETADSINQTGICSDLFCCALRSNNWDMYSTCNHYYMSSYSAVLYLQI